MANSIHNYKCCKDCLNNVEIFNHACIYCLPENNYQNCVDMNDEEAVRKNLWE